MYRSEFPGTMEEMLNAHTSEDLSAFCNFIKSIMIDSRISPIGAGLTPPSNRKADRITWIIECMRHRPLMEHLYYSRMNDMERAVLQETIHSADRYFDPMRFQAKHGSIPQTAYSRYRRYSQGDGSPAFPPLALFLGGSRSIPAELVTLLVPFIPKPQAFQAKVMASLPEIVTIQGYGEDDIAGLAQHLTEDAALNDLTAVLLLVDKGKVSVGAKTGKPTQTAVKAIRNVLAKGDFYPPECEAQHKWDVHIGPAGIRPFAWTLLLQAGGLVKINGTKLALTPTGKTALKKTAQESIARLWKRWLGNNLMHEMHRVEAIKGQNSRKRPLSAAAPCRQNIAEALAGLKEGDWMRTEDFFKMLIARGHNITPVRDAWPLYLGNPQYGSFGYNHVGWEHLEGRFARAFLLEYAATLGIIDVALVEPWDALNDLSNLWGADEMSCLSRYDGLWAIRLTALGAWVLGKTDAYEPSFKDDVTLRVLPNMEITLFSPETISSDTLFLDRFCKKVSDRVWRIELEKVLRAVEDGIDIQSIITFLTERNPQDLPQAVAAFFEDARNRTQRLRDMGAARLIGCSDRALALLIANDSELGKICLLAGDDCVVVTTDKERMFRKKLRQLGYALAR